MESNGPWLGGGAEGQGRRRPLAESHGGGPVGHRLMTADLDVISREGKVTLGARCHPTVVLCSVPRAFHPGDLCWALVLALLIPV